MLAAASPLLLSCLLETGQEEEDMVCLLLPDFSAAEVASVLSILYYGEIWTTNQIVHQLSGWVSVTSYVPVPTPRRINTGTNVQQSQSLVLAKRFGYSGSERQLHLAEFSPSSFEKDEDFMRVLKCILLLFQFCG